MNVEDRSFIIHVTYWDHVTLAVHQYFGIRGSSGLSSQMNVWRLRLSECILFSGQKKTILRKEISQVFLTGHQGIISSNWKIF
jgi:hypothetical protein